MNPRIYVACLSAYNNGDLHGKWIDAKQNESEIFAEISEMLKASPALDAEEWAVHDYEGFFGIQLTEWPDVARVAKVASLIDDHGEAFEIWYENQDAGDFDVEELEDKFLEQWQGAHDSESAFADHLLDDTGQLSGIPEWARNYFDFESYARDLKLSGDYTFVPHGGQVYVYSNH